MTKEDKQLKKEFWKEFPDLMACDYEEAKDDVWNWINKHYVSKKWVEKELIGEDEKHELLSTLCPSCKSPIVFHEPFMNLYKNELRNKLKEKE